MGRLRRRRKPLPSTRPCCRPAKQCASASWASLGWATANGVQQPIEACSGHPGRRAAVPRAVARRRRSLLHPRCTLRSSAGPLAADVERGHRQGC
eukprot:14972597-Alexandrium_andersonii.AAC.1